MSVNLLIMPVCPSKTSPGLVDKEIIYLHQCSFL